MIIEHRGHQPRIHETAFIAANATICGQVSIGRDTRVMYGAQIIAESSPITIGDNCIILENAVIRGTQNLPVRIGSHCLVGPHAHLAGCTIEDEVFVATGASVFHGAILKKGCELRINSVVHLKTVFPEKQILPIGWVAVGNPARIFPPTEHEQIWAIQKELDFPALVYDISAADDLSRLNRELSERMAERLKTHLKDRIV